MPSVKSVKNGQRKNPNRQKYGTIQDEPIKFSPKVLILKADCGKMKIV